MIAPAAFYASRRYHHNIDKPTKLNPGEQMRSLVEKSRYVVLSGVAALLVAAIIAFVWGTLKTITVVEKIIVSLGQDPQIPVILIQLVDVFLIASALFIFAVSLYELFISKLDLPDWMLAHNLNELKSKLSSVIVLVMAVKFLEKLIDWKDPQGTLLFGLAIAIVSGTLIALSYLNVKDGKDETKPDSTA